MDHSSVGSVNSDKKNEAEAMFVKIRESKRLKDAEMAGTIDDKSLRKGDQPSISRAMHSQMQDNSTNNTHTISSIKRSNNSSSFSNTTYSYILEKNSRTNNEQSTIDDLRIRMNTEEEEAIDAALFPVDDSVYENNVTKMYHGELSRKNSVNPPR